MVKDAHGDPRLNVARYQVDRLAGETAAASGEDGDNAGQPTMEQRQQYVEIAIQQAIRRGDFDDLPDAGKPLRNLTQTHDPDWWIRQKIEREKLTGLGPPALTLRTESAELDARLDRESSESTVRGILDDFNTRVIEARRQLQGGPPVVTPIRDVDAELAAWRERRDARRRDAAAADQKSQGEAAMRRTLRARLRVWGER